MTEISKPGVRDLNLGQQRVGNKVTLESQRKDTKGNAATGASAAGARAISARLVAFYFRAPAKAFFRTRVDYLAFVRAINPHIQAAEAWSLRMSTPALLGHAIRTYGWKFVPNQVLPPLLANVTVGAVLYTSYLQTLGVLHGPSSELTKRAFPPPSLRHTLTAGFIAGAVQSIVVAPLDALQVRFKTSDILNGKYKNMWHYGRHKLKEIGFRGVFFGWSLSFVKDSLGYGAFFATFEYVKAQAFYTFVTKHYGTLQSHKSNAPYNGGPYSEASAFTIKPHYTIEPSFLMLAGISAAVVQQIIQHPLALVQEIHYSRLESMDRMARKMSSRTQILRGYYRAYEKTYERCLRQAKQSGGWRTWLYRGFSMGTMKQIPSTSAGLIIFELVRRRYGVETEAVRIEKDGNVILLT